MEKPDALPNLQEVLASLLWFLGSPAPLCCQTRDRAVAQRQLRFVMQHRDTDPLLREVAAQLLVQLEGAVVACSSAAVGAEVRNGSAGADQHRRGARARAMMSHPSKGLSWT